jgi:hypothetical protein
MICPYCQKEAIWCENKEIYGKNYGKSYMCYYCKPCNAYVGCHNNTQQPLGTITNKEGREWRKKVHAKIDPLWKTGKIKRGHLYARISKAIGRTYHTGESTIEDCKKILELDILSL